MKNCDTNCEHCWHLNSGPLLMVVKNGHIVKRCCKCQHIQQVHKDHTKEYKINKSNCARYNSSWPMR